MVLALPPPQGISSKWDNLTEHLALSGAQVCSQSLGSSRDDVHQHEPTSVHWALSHVNHGWEPFGGRRGEDGSPRLGEGRSRYMGCERAAVCIVHFFSA